MNVVIGIALVLGALNAGFMLGRVFERIEWQHKFESYRRNHPEGP